VERSTEDTDFIIAFNQTGVNGQIKISHRFQVYINQLFEANFGQFQFEVMMVCNLRLAGLFVLLAISAQESSACVSSPLSLL
jgi:hypothetical protein